MTAHFPSPNFNAREECPIDILVLHYTGMESGAEARDRLCDPVAEVSAHYILDENGACEQLVDEADRAWHAGVSYWRGATNINSRSIGIELVNPGHEFGYRAFPDAQIGVLIELCQEILARHPIPARNVVGHSDVAPVRKIDPGELFPWARLADAGIGLWPADAGSTPPVAADAVASVLAEIGYDITDHTAAISAFQRHYRPSDFGGHADEETRRTLAALHELVIGSDRQTVG